MSQIRKKFIAGNAVDQTKVRLDNEGNLRARNVADDADINLLKLNSSDELEFGLLPIGPNANAPTSDAQLSNKKYIDDQVAALGTGAEWQDSCETSELDSDSLTPSTGDRNLINGVGVNDFAGHDNEIAVYNGASYDFTVPTTGTYVSVDSESSGIYYFGGVSWTLKQFENTTASTGLTKVGSDIRVDASLAGDGLAFAAGVLSVGTDDVTVELDSDVIRIKDLGVSTAKIADDAVGAAKINPDVAGIGLGQNVDGSLEVNVDDSTVEVSTDTLQVKASGIGENELNNVDGGVDAESFVLTSAFASGAGTVAGGDSIETAIEKLDGNIAAISDPTNEKEVIVLTGTDIINGYKDLTQVARVDSIHLGVIGGGTQIEGASYDYSVSYTGGVAGVTRITFANELASGGVSALEAGDVLTVKYEYI